MKHFDSTFRKKLFEKIHIIQLRDIVAFNGFSVENCYVLQQQKPKKMYFEPKIDILTIPKLSKTYFNYNKICTKKMYFTNAKK